MASGDSLWELLNADDLVLTAESKEEVTDMLNRWKEGMKHRGLKMNMEKTKSMATGNKARGDLEDSVRKMSIWINAMYVGWEQTLFFVLNVINGVTNDAQV